MYFLALHLILCTCYWNKFWKHIRLHGWNDFKDAHNALVNYDKQIDHMLEWTQGNKQNYAIHEANILHEIVQIDERSKPFESKYNIRDKQKTRPIYAINIWYYYFSMNISDSHDTVKIKFLPLYVHCVIFLVRFSRSSTIYNKK